MNKPIYYWYGVPVTARNQRISTALGLVVVDLEPHNTRWPENFPASTGHVVKSLLRTDPVKKKRLYLSVNSID